MKTYNLIHAKTILKFTLLMVFTILYVSFQSCSSDSADLQILENSLESDKNYSYSEKERLIKKIKPFYNFQVAQARGYTVQATNYRCGMGYHFLNPELLDDNFDLEHPEVLLYIPDANGIMQLVGVEYATPISDLSNPPPAPEGFGGDEDVWTISTEFSLWTLHAWPVIDNDCGFFKERNPKLEGSDDCNICD